MLVSRAQGGGRPRGSAGTLPASQWKDLERQVPATVCSRLPQPCVASCGRTMAQSHEKEALRPLTPLPAKLIIVTEIKQGPGFLPPSN